MSGRLDIVVPGLCGPFPRETVIPADGASASLAAWLQPADVVGSPRALPDVLASCLSLEGPLAMASLGLLAHTRQHRRRHAISVDPVHLRADMDHAILMDESLLDLRDTERAQLLAELNAHFAEDGLQLEAVAGRWYIISDQAFEIETTPVDDVIGRNVNHYLPRGEAAGYWRRFLNEAQMLLHMSAVNGLREGRGQLPVNSLWLWGEGMVAEADGARYGSIIGDDELAMSLSSLLDLPPVPCESARLAAADAALMVDTRLAKHACHGDVESWSRQLIEMLDERLLPLADEAVRKGLEVNVYPCDGRRYVLRRPSLIRMLSGLFRPPDPARVIAYDD